jgi:hypothetical protein
VVPIETPSAALAHYVLGSRRRPSEAGAPVRYVRVSDGGRINWRPEIDQSVPGQPKREGTVKRESSTRGLEWSRRVETIDLTIDGLPRRRTIHNTFVIKDD